MAGFSIEEFASVLAHLKHFGGEQRGPVLEHLEVRREDFDTAALEVPKAICNASLEGDEGPSDRFSAAFKSTQARLASERPTLEDIQPLAGAHGRRELAGLDEESTASLSGSEIGYRPLPFQPSISVQAPPSVPFDRVATSALSGPGGTLDPSPALTIEERTFEAWTVERFASFTAERRLGDADTVRKAYGIVDAIQEHALLVYMNRRIASIPSARERWMALVAARLAELGARGRA